ncbi:MAG TPA: hypothetical protein VGD99_05085, partial [Anaerolineae bacterium]
MEEATSEAERQLIEQVVQELYQYPNVSETDRPNFIHRILVRLHKSGEESVSAAVQPEMPVQTVDSDPVAEPEPQPETPAQTVDSDPVAEPEPQPETPAQTADSDPVAEPQPETPIQTADSDSLAEPEPQSEPALEGQAETSSAEPAPAPAPSVSTDQRSAANHSRPAPALSSHRKQSMEDLASAGLDSSVTKLPGIKDAMGAKLARLGVETIGDFLSLYPRRYDDYRTLKPINRLQYGEEVTIIAQVWETRKR